MECNVVKDLLPLYIDGCCSDESAKIVEGHLKTCPDCRKICESMNTPADLAAAPVPKKLTKICQWKASVLQSALLFVSFAIITVGVALEAGTPDGLMNGFWAFCLVIPATGFLLSLANWYFVRLYRSRKAFSNCSLLETLGITVCACIWGAFHYELGFSLLRRLGSLYGTGLVLTAVFCVLSKVLSGKYAAMVGKE